MKKKTVILLWKLMESIKKQLYSLIQAINLDPEERYEWGW